MTTLKEHLISLLFEHGIIETNFSQPFTLKSGIRSPIYCDFRLCTSHHPMMAIISNLFDFETSQKIINVENDIDIIFGVAIGAIPHSTLFASDKEKPSAYIRPGAIAKEHGKKKIFEGCKIENIVGKNIILIEDLVSTGGSILENALILRELGAKEIFLWSIFSYNFEEALEKFEINNFKFNSLLNINDIAPFLKERISKADYTNLINWTADPKGWYSNY